MRDVARLAGVSIATVSAVANGTARVSSKRMESVQRAMEALDYHSDQVARSLKTGRTHTIGMVIPDVTNAFFPEVIVGAEEVARGAHYSLILCNANENSEQEEQHLNTLARHRVDGILLACSDPSTHFDYLVRRRFPIVCFDRIPLGFRGNSVATNNIEGAYQATRHLIELGHKRIGLLAGPLALSTHSARIEGFRKAMASEHLNVVDEFCQSGTMLPSAGYDFGNRILSLPARPTAMFSTSNNLLLGFMRAVNQAGVRCPEEISVVGFDDFAWTENFHPPLTVVAQQSREIGRRAMELLIDKIENKSPENSEVQTILLNPELRIRHSTCSRTYQKKWSRKP